MKVRHHYIHVKTKSICVTEEVLDTSKCRKDIFPTSMAATREMQKKLDEGYTKLKAREFKRIL
jgi:hypothetical protein